MRHFSTSFLALAFAASFLGGCATYTGARHYARGSDALDAGKTDLAITHLERAARLVPHGSAIHNHLGIAYQAAGRRGEALEAYERAVAADCDNASAQHNLSALRAHLGLAEVDPGGVPARPPELGHE